MTARPGAGAAQAPSVARPNVVVFVGDDLGWRDPDYAAVRAPALALYAVPDSAPQMFPGWGRLDSTGRVAARHFTAVLQGWAAAERTRFRRELPTGQVVELHGAHHYVFFSHAAEVTRAMRTFLTRAGEQRS